jgi:glycyl-tRNA synthetase
LQLFEHSFRIRPDNEQRTYLSLPAIMAPIKCSVLPVGHIPKIAQAFFYLFIPQLSGNDEFPPFVQKLAADLTAAQVRNTVDDSGGK